jgi:hypothetical protein
VRTVGIKRSLHESTLCEDDLETRTGGRALLEHHFHYGVSLSGQFALQHVFDEEVKHFGPVHLGTVSSTL